MDLIRGRSVTVLRPVDAGRDDWGEPIEDMRRERVENVLVEPVSTADLGEERPNGARRTVRLHFPKGYGKGLRGCSVEVGERVYAIVGDPLEHDPSLCPGPWNLTAEGVEADG